MNKEIFPPEADITYESFFESAKHGTASSGFISPMSLVINIPLAGCHNCGWKLVVAYKNELLWRTSLKPKWELELTSIRVLIPFLTHAGQISAISRACVLY